MADCVAPMLFRLILVLAIVGALTVFTVQNLTPLLPLVFLGIRFPALPLSWWVLGAIAAGALTMLAIQVLFGLSNFVTGQTVRSRVRSNSQRSGSQNRWSTTASSSNSVDPATQSASRGARPTSDDAAWKDWRAYETSAPRTTPDPGARKAAVKEPVDDWERPLSDDWEDTTPPSTRSSANRSSADHTSDRVTPEDLKNFEVKQSPKHTSQSGSSYSYSFREPEDSGVGKPEKVVDAEYRVIVPPYRPLDETTPPPVPPPPPVEENADDWFEDSSDEFGDETRDR